MESWRKILEEAEERRNNNMTITFTPREVNYLIKKMMRIPIHMELEEEFAMWFEILEKFGLEKVIDNLKSIFGPGEKDT